MSASRAPQYEHAIAVLIGVPPAQFSIPYQHFNQPLPVIPVGVPSDLLERRPDIAAAERQVAQTNAADRRRARGVLSRPSRLTRPIGYESTALSKLFEAPNRFWSVGPELGADRCSTAASGAPRLLQARALRRCADRDLPPDGAERVSIGGGQPGRAAHPVAGARAAARAPRTAAKRTVKLSRGALPQRRRQLCERHHRPECLSHGARDRAAGAAAPIDRERESDQRSRRRLGPLPARAKRNARAKHPPGCGQGADQCPPTMPVPRLPIRPRMPTGEIKPDDFIKLNDDATDRRVKPDRLVKAPPHPICEHDRHDHRVLRFLYLCHGRGAGLSDAVFPEAGSVGRSG